MSQVLEHAPTFCELMQNSEPTQFEIERNPIPPLKEARLEQGDVTAALGAGGIAAILKRSGARHLEGTALKFARHLQGIEMPLDEIRHHTGAMLRSDVCLLMADGDRSYTLAIHLDGAWMVLAQVSGADPTVKAMEGAMIYTGPTDAEVASRDALIERHRRYQEAQAAERAQQERIAKRFEKPTGEISG